MTGIINESNYLSFFYRNSAGLVQSREFYAISLEVNVFPREFISVGGIGLINYFEFQNNVVIIPVGFIAPRDFFLPESFGMQVERFFESWTVQLDEAIFTKEFNPLTSLQILLGRKVHQNIDYLSITKSELGIINLDNSESIFAGILFNSLYAFDSNSNINSELWENIKSIRENEKRYLYGVIVVTIKEKFND